MWPRADSACIVCNQMTVQLHNMASHTVYMYMLYIHDVGFAEFVKGPQQVTSFVKSKI